MQLRRGKIEEGGFGHHPLIVYLVRAGTIQTELLLGWEEKAREAWIDGSTLTPFLYEK